MGHLSLRYLRYYALYTVNPTGFLAVANGKRSGPLGLLNLHTVCPKLGLVQRTKC